VVLDRHAGLAGNPDEAPQALAQPADAPPPLPALADGEAIGRLRAARASLAARDDAAGLAVRVRAWAGRVTGRTDRYVLEAVVRATDEVVGRCDALAARLASQEKVTADVTHTFGEELARLRAEVLHLQRLVQQAGGTTEPAR
jgi:hypothetical protein